MAKPVLITVSANNQVPSGYARLSATKDGKIIAIAKDVALVD